MSWFLKKDPPPHKCYYDLYMFEPKDDITAYELSLIWSNIAMGDTGCALKGCPIEFDKGDRTLLDVVGRHFRFCGEA